MGLGIDNVKLKDKWMSCDGKSVVEEVVVHLMLFPLVVHV